MPQADRFVEIATPCGSRLPWGGLELTLNICGQANFGIVTTYPLTPERLVTADCFGSAVDVLSWPTRRATSDGSLKGTCTKITRYGLLDITLRRQELAAKLIRGYLELLKTQAAMRGVRAYCFQLMSG